MKPPRTSSLWLTASASAGSSRRVGRKSCDARATIVAAAGYSSGISEASAIASAAGLAIFRRFGRCMPVGDPLVDLVEELVDQDVGRDLLQHAAVRVDEADVAAAGDPEVGVARLARAVDGAAEHGDLEVLRVVAEALLDLDSRASRRRRCRGRSDGQAIMIGPRSRRPSDLRISKAVLTSSTGSAVSETRIVSPIPSTSSAPIPTALLIEPGERRAGLGDAEVQRVRHLLGRASGRRGSSSARGST